MRHEAKDMEIRQRLPGRSRDLLHRPETPLAIDERSLLLSPAGSGQDEVRGLRRFNRRIQILHYKEFELLERVFAGALMNPRMRGICSHHPETLDFAIGDSLHDLIVRPRIALRDIRDRYAEDSGNVS